MHKDRRAGGKNPSFQADKTDAALKGQTFKKDLFLYLKHSFFYTLSLNIHVNIFNCASCQIRKGNISNKLRKKKISESPVVHFIVNTKVQTRSFDQKEKRKDI